MCTFKLDEQLIGKTSQIALQIIPLVSNAFHFLALDEIRLLPAQALLVGVIQSRLQPGILFFQLADRSQLLFGQSGPVVSLLTSNSQILVLLCQSFSQLFCEEMVLDSERAEGYSSPRQTSRQTRLTIGTILSLLQLCLGQLQVKAQLDLLFLQISKASSQITRFLQSKRRSYFTAKNNKRNKY